MSKKKEIANFDLTYKTQNNMTEFTNGFRKEGLEFLKKRYKKTTDEFIKATYPKKEQANMRVKISRLINKPVNAPGYFDAMELANDLSKFFNQFTGADARYGICQDKQSKVIHLGYLQPNSNGRYDIQDRSWSTGKVNLPNIATDITPSWTSRIETELYPSYWDY